MSNNIKNEDSKIPTKEKILLAASELFLKKDFKAVSIQEIAEVAGVAKGTVFLHYQNKHLLALAVLDSFIVQMNSDIDKMKEEMKPEEIIVAMIQYSMEFVESSAGLTQLLFQIIADIDFLSKEPQNEIEIQIKKEAMKIESLLIGYISEFASIFEKMGFKNPEAHSRIFIAVLDGLSLQLMLNPKPDKKLMGQLAESMIELFKQR